MVAMRADEGWHVTRRQVVVMNRTMQEEGEDGRKDEDKQRTTLFRLGSFMHDASLVHSSTCGFHHIRVNPHTFITPTMHYARRN